MPGRPERNRTARSFRQLSRFQLQLITIPQRVRANEQPDMAARHGLLNDAVLGCPNIVCDIKDLLVAPGSVLLLNGWQVEFK
jgi:hypothetical protein